MECPWMEGSDGWPPSRSPSEAVRPHGVPPPDCVRWRARLWDSPQGPPPTTSPLFTPKPGFKNAREIFATAKVRSLYLHPSSPVFGLFLVVLVKCYFFGQFCLFFVVWSFLSVLVILWLILVCFWSLLGIFVSFWLVSFGRFWLDLKPPKTHKTEGRKTPNTDQERWTNKKQMFC